MTESVKNFITSGIAKCLNCSISLKQEGINKNLQKVSKRGLTNKRKYGIM